MLEFTLGFLKLLVLAVHLFLPVLLFLALVVTALGQLVGRLESWSRFDAFYWSFITALTVGYGDIRPLRRASRVLSIVIAFTGLILTGIIVAIAVQCAARAFEIHVLEDLERAATTGPPTTETRRR